MQMLSGNIAPMNANPLFKRILTLVIATFCIVMQAAQVDPKLAQEFAKRYEAWDNALIKVDLNYLRQLYSDDYRSINPDSTISTREEFLANLKAGKEVIHSAKTDQLTLEKHGDSVVATSRWISKETQNGKAVGVQSRWTDLWVKRAGRWQIVASHGCDISDTEAEAIQKITQLYKEWDAADMKGDLAALDRLIADDYVGTSPEGAVESKAQILAELKSGELKVLSAVTDDVKITVYGNTAVGTGRWTANGKNIAKGKTWGGVHRFTDTWVFRDGRWQAVADQLTKIEVK